MTNSIQNHEAVSKLTADALEELRLLNEAPDSLAIDPRQFCLLANWALGTLYQKRANGTLPVPYRKHGRLVRYVLGDVKRYLASCQIDPTSV